MLALWEISSFPRCRFHVFLSHCAEDREWLVGPLFERLRRKQIIPWVDSHHYPAGTDPFEALREGILECRHVICLVTLGMLAQARGWAQLEKAYAGLLQDNLRFGSAELCRVELPLFFVTGTHEVLARSIWSPIARKGRFHAPHDGDEVEWAADEIEGFLFTQERRALSLGSDLENDPRFDRRPGLIDRVQANFPVHDPRPPAVYPVP